MELLKRYVVYGDDFGLLINNLKQGKHYSEYGIDNYIDNKLNGRTIMMLVSPDKKDLYMLSNYKNDKRDGIEYMFFLHEPYGVNHINKYINDDVHGMRMIWNSNGSLRRLYTCIYYYTM